MGRGWKASTSQETETTATGPWPPSWNHTVPHPDSERTVGKFPREGWSRDHHLANEHVPSTLATMIGSRLREWPIRTQAGLLLDPGKRSSISVGSSCEVRLVWTGGSRRDISLWRLGKGQNYQKFVSFCKGRATCVRRTPASRAESSGEMISADVLKLPSAALANACGLG